VAAPDWKQVLEQADQERIQGRYEQALPLYERVLETEPVNLRARLGVAHCLLNIGEFDLGLEHFQRAAADHPESSEAALLHAKMLLMLDRTEEGRAELQRVLELDPDNPEAKRHLSYL